tara:strand:+ start:99 stop:695 length:597 start_codon:yes stop_codon:yes gene_type:complete
MIKLNKTQKDNATTVNEILVVNVQNQVADIKKNIKKIFNYSVLAKKNDFSNEFFALTMPVLVSKNKKGKLIRNRDCSFKNYPTFFKTIADNEKIVLSKEFQKTEILGFDGLYKFIQKTNKPKIENSKNSKTENSKNETENSNAEFAETQIDFESLVVLIQDSFDKNILDTENMYSLKEKIDFMIKEKSNQVLKVANKK